MILLQIKLELKHRIEGLDVVQNGLRIRNNTRLMEDLVKHSAPIRLSLMAFWNQRTKAKVKDLGASQDTDLLFEEKAI